MGVENGLKEGHIDDQQQRRVDEPVSSLANTSPGLMECQILAASETCLEASGLVDRVVMIFPFHSGSMNLEWGAGPGNSSFTNGFQNSLVIPAERTDRLHGSGTGNLYR
jgi:hypothetical protein